LVQWLVATVGTRNRWCVQGRVHRRCPRVAPGANQKRLWPGTP